MRRLDLFFLLLSTTIVIPDEIENFIKIAASIFQIWKCEMLEWIWKCWQKDTNY
jgi:hypothetical protein